MLPGTGGRLIDKKLIRLAFWWDKYIEGEIMSRRIEFNPNIWGLFWTLFSRGSRELGDRGGEGAFSIIGQGPAGSFDAHQG